MLRLNQRATDTVVGDAPRTKGKSAARGDDMGSRRRRRARAKAPALAGVLVALASMAAGCGGGSSATTTARASASTTPATTSTATNTASASESGLSGQWKGRYGGAYNGTFVLHWQQSGSSLGGKITISSPLSTLDVNGTLHGSAITFGTVGSLAITYTGTVAGSSMSGSYRTPGGGGSWSASKG